MIEAINLSKIYPATDHTKEVFALKDVNVKIDKGEFVSIIGLSGAGKSTFLRCINRMNTISKGKMIFNGEDITEYAEHQLRDIRRKIGFIFQQFNLVKNISVLNNVLIGRIGYNSVWKNVLGKFSKEDIEKAKHYINEVGLIEKLKVRADNLSGGQQQRVAIARAVVQEPDVILADEPMASLDPKLSDVILGLLKKFNSENNITILLNVHVIEYAKKYSSRIIGFNKGEIVFDGKPDDLDHHTIEHIYKQDKKELENL
ncbi:MAG: phosphonate ABC transporter ATP-binding protein [Ignavibacteria bacterium]|nr:phosphonate ABC transporter ATP-binding protein [Ignavibacteria bacterium]